MRGLRLARKERKEKKGKEKDGGLVLDQNILELKLMVAGKTYAGLVSAGEGVSVSYECVFRSREKIVDRVARVRRYCELVINLVYHGGNMKCRTHKKRGWTSLKALYDQVLWLRIACLDY